MESRVQKWGNSLGLRIPKAFAEEVGVRAGSPVDVTVERGALVVRPSSSTYRLDQLLEAVTPENLHSEMETGLPVGDEVW